MIIAYSTVKKKVRPKRIFFGPVPAAALLVVGYYDYDYDYDVMSDERVVVMMMMLIIGTGMRVVTCAEKVWPNRIPFFDMSQQNN